MSELIPLLVLILVVSAGVAVVRVVMHEKRTKREGRSAYPQSLSHDQRYWLQNNTMYLAGWHRQLGNVILNWDTWSEEERTEALRKESFRRGLRSSDVPPPVLNADAEYLMNCMDLEEEFRLAVFTAYQKGETDVRDEFLDEWQSRPWHGLDDAELGRIPTTQFTPQFG